MRTDLVEMTEIFLNSIPTEWIKIQNKILYTVGVGNEVKFNNNEIQKERNWYEWKTHIDMVISINCLHDCKKFHSLSILAMGG